MVPSTVVEKKHSSVNITTFLFVFIMLIVFICSSGFAQRVVTSQDICVLKLAVAPSSTKTAPLPSKLPKGTPPPPRKAPA
jgi:hypothetical protein